MGLKNRMGSVWLRLALSLSFNLPLGQDLYLTLALNEDSAMKVAISQSNYIPWKGYIDNIAQVDKFVLYDDVQYTKRDWRNRNKIKTVAGTSWMSIPVEVKGRFNQKINETRISNPSWNIDHLNILKNSYAKATCYEEIIEKIEGWYMQANFQLLSEINHHFLSNICDFLSIDTQLISSSEFKLLDTGKTERLVDLCLQLGADTYYTGSAAKAYMDESLFESKGIKVEYYDYSNYPEYRQLYGEFEHGVSVLDLMFNEGESSRGFLKY